MHQSRYLTQDVVPVLYTSGLGERRRDSSSRRQDVYRNRYRGDSGRAEEMYARDCMDLYRYIPDMR